ncbi:MAG: PTS sugar transporter subunit IIA [Alphaproteobacteria bacterium]
MIGLVLVTHGRLAAEFAAALEHVVGPQEQIEAVCIDADDDMEQRRKDIVDAATRVARGMGVVILTDMFGGTPSNLAISVMDSKIDGGPVEVIAGLNLPMLIKLAQARDDLEFPALVEAAQTAGRKYISVASALLSTKPA